MQNSFVFEQRPLVFSTDAARVNYVGGPHTGRALALAEVMNSSVPQSSHTLKEFKSPLSHYLTTLAILALL